MQLPGGGPSPLQGTQPTRPRDVTWWSPLWDGEPTFEAIGRLNRRFPAPTSP